MNHLFIPYELALLAKQKGFNEECFRYYHTDKSLRTISDGYLNEVCVAPLYQQIVDWLRVTYSIDILLNKEFGEYVFETWFGAPQSELCSTLGSSALVNNPEVKRTQEASTSGELIASVNKYDVMQPKTYKKLNIKSVIVPIIKNCNPEAKRPRSEVSSASGGVSALGLKQNKTLPDSGSNKIKRIIGITLIIIGAIILIFAMLFASAPEFADALLWLIIMALIGIGLYILGLLLLLKNRKHKPEIDKITK